jgi:hypothetical protein
MRSRNVKAPAKGGDLLQIKGLGPASLNRLQQAGLHTCAQLAALSPAELVKRVPRLRVGHATLERWITQAGRIAAPPRSRKIRPQTPALELPSSQPGAQRYATFTIELLLDEAGRVRRTRAVHVQGGQQAMWAEWDGEQLIGFLTQQSGLRHTAAKAQALRPKPSLAQPSAPQTAASVQSPLTIREVRLKIPAQASALGTAEEKMLRVEIDVVLSGPALETLAERTPRLAVTALACEAGTGQTMLLGSSQTLLDAPILTVTIPFSTPGQGDHLILAQAALPELELAALAAGPRLKVVAPQESLEEDWLQPATA